MQKLFENWRRYLNETPFGGYNPGLAGTLDFGQGTVRMSHKPDKKDPPDDIDTKFVVIKLSIPATLLCSIVMNIQTFSLTH